VLLNSGYCGTVAWQHGGIWLVINFMIRYNFYPVLIILNCVFVG
jgi:hypothetical protein